jgi:hypothetical protein
MTGELALRARHGLTVLASIVLALSQNAAAQEQAAAARRAPTFEQSTRS